MLTSFVSGSPISIADAGLVVVMGLIVVFTGLALLFAVISLMAKIATSKRKQAEPEIQKAVEQSVCAPEAKGTAGQVKLFDVSDREAAMIMAIVADQMNRPLNELRFLSIKEGHEP